jgi:hypothetical protein
VIARFTLRRSVDTFRTIYRELAEGGELVSGSVQQVPGTSARPLHIPRPRRAPGRSEDDPIDELADRLEEFVAAAVHPDETAALLESDGMSDERVRERYGVGSSFALAEELYDRVPRRHPEPDIPARDPWWASLLGCLLRGVVFALPGLAYVLGAPLPYGVGPVR